MFAWPESLLKTGSGSPVADRPAGPLALLTVEGVRRAYGSRPVLAGADLRIEAGSVAWLGGPNGAGKTTLLRIIAGVLAPEAGTVRVHGLDPDRDRRAFQRRLGYLPAGDRGLTPRLTVRQQLELWAALALLGDRRRELVDATLARLELEALADRRVERLSMGQRQRVRLALAFLHEPDVVLLDEPHTSLDEFGLALLEDALAGVTARGGAVLWCSPVAARLPLPADERYVLSEGRVRAG